MPISRNFSLPSSLEARKFKKRPEELQYVSISTANKNTNNINDDSINEKQSISTETPLTLTSSSSTPTVKRSFSPKIMSTRSRSPVARVTLSHPCLSENKKVGATTIFPHLFLGSQDDVIDQAILRDNSITYILNVSCNCTRPESFDDEHFRRISVKDNYQEKIIPYLDEAIEFIESIRKKKEKVLVHCLAGVSRSATVAIAYVMHYLRLSFDDAYRFVKDKRPTISPNFNFLGQLMEYEKKLKEENHYSKPRTGSIPDDNIISMYRSLDGISELKSSDILAAPLFRCTARKTTNTSQQLETAGNNNTISGHLNRPPIISSFSRRRKGPTLDKISFDNNSESRKNEGYISKLTCSSPGGAGVVLDLEVLVRTEPSICRLGSDGVEDEDVEDSTYDNKSNSLPRNMALLTRKYYGNSSCPTPPASIPVKFCDKFAYARSSTAPNTPGNVLFGSENNQTEPLIAFERFYPRDVEMTQIDDDSPPSPRARSRTFPSTFYVTNAETSANVASSICSFHSDKLSSRKSKSPKVFKKSSITSQRPPYHHGFRNLKYVGDNYALMPQRSRTKDAINLKLGPIRSLAALQHCESSNFEGLSSLTLDSPSVVDTNPLEVVGRKYLPTDSSKRSAYSKEIKFSDNPTINNDCGKNTTQGCIQSKSGGSFNLASSGELRLKWRKRTSGTDTHNNDQSDISSTTPPVLSRSCSNNVGLVSCS